MLVLFDMTVSALHTISKPYDKLLALSGLNFTIKGLLTRMMKCSAYHNLVYDH